METSEKKGLLKAAAQKMLQLHTANKEHEKRAHAIRLLYKQAELGLGEVPRSHKDLQEKVAGLLNQDLIVVEKALELAGGGMPRLGELGGADLSVARNPEEQFQAAVLNSSF